MVFLTQAQTKLGVNGPFDRCIRQGDHFVRFEKSALLRARPSRYPQKCFTPPYLAAFTFHFQTPRPNLTPCQPHGWLHTYPPNVPSAVCAWYNSFASEV